MIIDGRKIAEETGVKTEIYNLPVALRLFYLSNLQNRSG